MKRSSQDLVDQHTQAHERAIGKIVIAWNEYHERLGELFAQLFGRRHWGLALAAWHALENDRAQRSMLAAVARTKLKPTNSLLPEIIWLIENTHQVISDQRNTGIHMPLMRYTDEDGEFYILPLAMFGNQRAARMTGQDLLAEFAHYEKQIRQMNGCATALGFALTPRNRRRGPAKLPPRPQLLKRAPVQPRVTDAPQ